MPKVLFQSQKKDLIASGVIAKWLTVRGYKQKDFGPLLGLSEQSGRNRIKKPGTLTLDEMRRMKLTLEELKEMYGA